MRAVVQVASEASVEVDGAIVGRLERPGLVVLVGVTHDDTPDLARRLAQKVHELRILDDERSCSETNAPLLVISQFTLYADVRKGRRPTWNAAAPRAVAEPLVDAVIPVEFISRTLDRQALVNDILYLRHGAVVHVLIGIIDQKDLDVLHVTG